MAIGEARAERQDRRHAVVADIGIVGVAVGRVVVAAVQVFVETRAAEPVKPIAINAGRASPDEIRSALPVGRPRRPCAAGRSRSR